MLLIILSAFLVSELHLAVVHSDTYVPWTEDYKFVGNLLRNAIDRTVLPCEDFYAFACHGYNRRNHYTTRQEQLDAQISDRLHTLLNTVTSQENMPSEVLGLLKGIYSQCRLYSGAILHTSAWAEEMRDVIDTLGGMPLFNKKKVYKCEPVEFARFLAKSHKMNMFYYSQQGIAAPAFFTPSVVETSRFHPENIMKLEMQFEGRLASVPLSLVQKSYLNVIKNYSQLIRQDFKDEQKADIDLLAELGHNLEKFKNGAGPETDIPYNQLKTIIKSIDLDAYFLELLPEYIPMQFTKNKNPTIRVTLNFFQKLEEQFRNYSCEVKYNLVYMKLIHGNFVINFAEGTKQDVCIDALATSPLKVGLSALYLQSHVAEARNVLTGLKFGMGKWIKKAMKNLLKEADWIASTDTHDSVLYKLKRMDMISDGSNLFYTKSYLANYHNGILFDGKKNYYQNRRAIAKWSMDVMMRRLDNGAQCVHDYWYRNYALEANAFYKFWQNDLVINPGYTQEPFYKPTYPNFYNYGIYGFVIGHEMTHGFDNNGRRFDAGGAFRNNWDNNTEEQYMTRATSCAEQYGKITVKEVGMKINGWQTLNENIADNGGIKAAFKAYKAWEKEQGRQEHDLGFGLEKITIDQLFFISAAQPYCGSRKVEDLKYLLANGLHSPNKYRVNIPLKNYKAFTDAFHCWPGQNMHYDPNGKDRCNVW